MRFGTLSTNVTTAHRKASAIAIPIVSTAATATEVLGLVAAPVDDDVAGPVREPDRAEGGKRQEADERRVRATCR